MKEIQNLVGFCPAILSILLFWCVTVGYGDKVQDGVSIKINFGRRTTVNTDDNKYLKKAREYLDAMNDNFDPPFPGFVDVAANTVDQGSGRADLHFHFRLFQLSYRMSYITGDPKYRTSINEYLRETLNTDNTGLVNWSDDGGQSYWTVQPLESYYRVRPIAAENLALHYWIGGVGNKLTGNFNRHHSCNATGAPFPDDALMRIKMYMHAFKHTWTSTFLKHTRTVMELMETNRYDNGYLGMNYQTKSTEPCHNVDYTVGVGNMLPLLDPRNELTPYLKTVLERSDNAWLQNYNPTTVDQLYPGSEYRMVLYPLARIGDRYIQALSEGKYETAARLKERFLNVIGRLKSFDPDPTQLLSYGKLHYMVHENPHCVIYAYLLAHRLDPDAGYLAEAEKWAEAMLTHLFDMGPIPRRIIGDTQAGNAHASHTHAIFLVGLAKADPHYWLSECF